MRLDKFLKVSRIIKRRPIAKIVVDGGKAKLNGKVAKPSTEVKEGQILELEYYSRYLKFEILKLPANSIPKDKINDFIKLIDSKGIDINNINEKLNGEEEIFEEV